MNFYVSELQPPVAKHWHQHVPTQLKVPASCWLSRTSAINGWVQTMFHKIPYNLSGLSSSVPLCFGSLTSVGRCLLITVRASSTSEIVWKSVQRKCCRTADNKLPLFWIKYSISVCTTRISVFTNIDISSVNITISENGDLCFLKRKMAC